ncbi:MAG: two-component system response regulator LytT [Flavobacteriales bacterium]|jgi:two-component system response regulator LytT
MAFNILVTEDESIVRKDIEKTLQKLGYNVVGTADTGEKAIELATTLKPDLALMDIMLKGEMTGIEAAEKIKSKIDIPIIFLTAYADEKTLGKAKITEPHGYILKPFKEIDIQTSIEIAIHKHKKESELKVENDLLRSLARHNADADYLFVKNKSRLVKLNTSNIIAIEALKDYVVINTIDENYTIHSTMKDIERKLPEQIFQRVHRSFIVNMDKVEAIQAANLVLTGYSKEVPIGGSYRDSISERINVL